MAKFRTNHHRGKRAKFTLLRVIIFAIAVVSIMILLYQQLSRAFSADPDISTNYTVPNAVGESDRYYLPTGGRGEVVHHKHYSLSYVEKHEQAEWVAYELTRALLKVPNVKRVKRYNPDYSVSTRSAFHRDYTGSGYTRGHLAPAGDMAFDELAMQESFFMSNMSPQSRPFNNGIWKELEEQVRDWAYTNNKVYVVTGPMLNRPYVERIGQNKVSVPSAFYKVILDLEKPDQKAIAFIIPHKSSDRRLQEYAVTIDSLESELGIDLFANLMTVDKQAKIESQIDLKDWKFSEKRYQQRVDKWNNQ